MFEEESVMGLQAGTVIGREMSGWGRRLKSFILGARDCFAGGEQTASNE